MPEQFIKPFPAITWDRNYGEKPGNRDLPTKDTTTLFDPVEQLVLRRGKLLSQIELGRLVLPPIGQGTVVLADAIDTLGGWLIAPRSDERRKAKKAVDRFMEREEGAKAIDALIELQPPTSPYLAKIEELNNVLERTIKPPSFFRVRGLFQPHRTETSQELDNLKEQLRTEMRQTFRAKDNNIVFMEDARGYFYQNKDFYDAYKEYRSLRKAFVFVREKHHSGLSGSFVELRKRNGRAVDILVDKQIQMLDLVAKPEADPELAYLWTVMQVADEFIREGYQMQMMFERGSDAYRLPPLTRGDAETMPHDEFAEKLMEWMRIMENRLDPSNKDIAKQLVELESSVDPTIKTNVLMIFGSMHIGVTDNLPERLKQVTTQSFRP